MTKEDIFKTFMEDPLLVEKKYISEEKSLKIRLSEPSDHKLIEVIKIAINGNVGGETDGVISRKINQFLNK